MECNRTHPFTRRQKAVAAKVKKLCGDLKDATLSSKLALHRHELKVTNTKLLDMRKKAERSRINTLFFRNQRQIFRDWKSKKPEILNPPTIDNVQSFWADIWEKVTPIHTNTEWYRKLEGAYCIGATTKQYVITEDIFNQVVLCMPNNKAPGRDRITGLWVKRLIALHENLLQLFQQTFKGELVMRDWLITSMTILIPKNIHTHLEKNYRSIACLNTTYKLYSGILNTFIEDHCITNDVITVEQAGGKKGCWGV